MVFQNSAYTTYNLNLPYHNIEINDKLSEAVIPVMAAYDYIIYVDVNFYLLSKTYICVENT